MQLQAFVGKLTFLLSSAALKTKPPSLNLTIQVTSIFLQSSCCPAFLKSPLVSQVPTSFATPTEPQSSFFINIKFKREPVSDFAPASTWSLHMEYDIKNSKWIYLFYCFFLSSVAKGLWLCIQNSHNYTREETNIRHITAAEKPHVQQGQWRSWAWWLALRPSNDCYLE